MQHAKIMNLVQSEVYESSKNRVSMYLTGKKFGRNNPNFDIR